jgi:hypothetical protein
MTNEIDLGEPETVTVHTTPEHSKTVPVFYANQVYMANTPWDIQMMFGSLRGINVGNAIAEPLVNIIMSPVHAKVMSQILRKQVERYEAQFGAIQLNLAAATDTPMADSESKVKLPPPRRRKKKSA